MACLQCGFLNNFTDAYLRNNRRGGQKNLRCFPQCDRRGHQCSGFCGRSVEISVTAGNPGTPGSTAGGMIALAEFVSLGRPGASSSSSPKKSKKKRSKVDVPVDPLQGKMQVGATVAAALLGEQTRSKTTPLRRFVAGKVDNSDETVFGAEACAGAGVTLRFLPTCWHYAWRSNKHTTNTEHCLRVYFFDLLPEGQARCCKIVDSPKFTLYSSKIMHKKNPEQAAVIKRAMEEKANESRRKAKRARLSRKQSPVSIAGNEFDADFLFPSLAVGAKENASSFAFAPGSPTSVVFSDHEDLHEEDKDSLLPLDVFIDSISTTEFDVSKTWLVPDLSLKAIDTFDFEPFSLKPC